MSDLNCCTFTGRVGTDLELKTTTNGKSFLRIGLAVHEAYAGKKKVNWISVVAWGKLAEICAEYLAKGSYIAVQAKASDTQYETGGEKRRKIEFVADRITFLPKESQGQAQPESDPSDDLPF